MLHCIHKWYFQKCAKVPEGYLGVPLNYLGHPPPCGVPPHNTVYTTAVIGSGLWLPQQCLPSEERKKERKRAIHPTARRQCGHSEPSQAKMDEENNHGPRCESPYPDLHSRSAEYADVAHVYTTTVIGS